MNWVSVTEQLPPTDVDVLVHVPGASYPVWPAFLSSEGVWNWASGIRIVLPVMHWMPMPPPPCEGRVE